MALTPEQIKSLKAQLSEQIEHLPPEQKESARQQIESLSPEALEAMIEQQKSNQGKKETKEEKPIFRKIIDKDVPSALVDENKKALAVLDIFPISKGHAIIISKKAVKDAKDIPSEAMALAKKIAKRIAVKLKASSVQIITEKKFGETIINLLPAYESPVDLNSKRTQASPEELESIAKKLRPIRKRTPLKIKSLPAGQPLKLKRRIP